MPKKTNLKEMPPNITFILSPLFNHDELCNNHSFEEDSNFPNGLNNTPWGNEAGETQPLTEVSRTCRLERDCKLSMDEEPAGEERKDPDEGLRSTRRKQIQLQMLRIWRPTRQSCIPTILKGGRDDLFFWRFWKKYVSILGFYDPEVVTRRPLFRLFCRDYVVILGFD